MPWGVVSVVVAANFGHIDWYNTLSTGNLAFVADSLSAIHPLAAGVSFDHAFVVKRYRFFYSTVAHELVHIYQFRDYLVFNAWLEPFVAKTRGRKWADVAERYIYADIPWSRLFFILEVARVRKLDEVRCHYANFFEYEAEKLSGPDFVNRCR